MISLFLVVIMGSDLNSMGDAMADIWFEKTLPATTAKLERAKAAVDYLESRGGPIP